MQHLVLIDEARAAVFRFPRTPGRSGQMRIAAERLRLLAGTALPVPELLDARLSDQLGEGHLVLRLLPGTPLDEVSTDALPAQARTRLLAELDLALSQIRALDVTAWPDPGPEWELLWRQLESAAEARQWPGGLAAHCQRVVVRAAATAAAAPQSVFHGDLGGVNCRIDPQTGSITGLLDWDSAAVGDPATDVAAILAGLGPATATQLRAEFPWWESAEQRYQAYVDTWPLQFLIWAQDHGSAADRSSAEALLSRSAPAPTQ